MIRLSPIVDNLRELGRDGLMLSLGLLAALASLAWLVGVGR